MPSPGESGSYRPHLSCHTPQLPPPQNALPCYAPSPNTTYRIMPNPLLLHQLYRRSSSMYHLLLHPFHGTSVPVPDRCLVVIGLSCVDSISIFCSAGAFGFASNLLSATAKSSACTSLFGGSSLRISQPIGGLGGGEMKKSLELSGACRCWSSMSIFVSAPK